MNECKVLNHLKKSQNYLQIITYKLKYIDKFSFTQNISYYFLYEKHENVHQIK